MKLLGLVLLFAAALVADITGKWTASFETQVGTQDYTWTFKVDGEKLTGTWKSNMGSGDILEGKINGEEVTFAENLKFQDQEIHITYKGKITGDEIKFTRQVADFGSEELVAKRVK